MVNSDNALADTTLDEIRILALFNPASTLEGIKVHHNAAPSAISAAQRLFEKELITLPDGGYLTALGQEALRHLDGLLTIICPQK
ncbi:MAG: TIGR02647 family protein [Porticoccaceae bacterium]|nr:TIGR02647 family protein [Porticoccaceae bacterium]